MKIKKVTIENFMGIKNVSIEPTGDSMLLVGNNGAGKSSIQSALQYALFGRCYDHAGKRVTNADILRIGADFAHVAVDIAPDNGNEFTAQVMLSRNKRTGAVEAKRSAQLINALFVAEAGAAGAQIAEVCGNPKAYLHSDELRSLLANLCTPTITKDMIAEYCGDAWTWFNKMLKQWSLPFPASIDALDAIGQRAYDDRRAQNAKLKEIEAVKQKTSDRSWVPVHPQTGKLLTVADIPTVEKSLEEARKILADYRAQLRDAVQTENAKAVDIEKAKAQLPDLETAEAKAKAERERVEADQINMNAEATSLRQKSSDLRGRLIMMKAKSEGDVCPECGQEITKKAAAQFTKRREDMQRELKDCEAHIEELSPSIKELAATVQAARETHQKAAYAAQSVREILAKMPKVEPKAREATPEDLQKTIGLCEEKVKRGEDCLAALRRLETIEKLDTDQAEIDALKADIEMLNWCVKAFKDGEFQATVSGSGIADFEGRCGEFLKPFGYGVFFDMNEGQVYLCRGDDKIKIASASKGEQVLAQCAVAFAFDTSTPIMLDDLDGLSYANKGRVLMLLRDLKRPVIMGAAWGLPDAPKAKELQAKLNPCTVAWIDNGEVKEVA